MQTRNDGKPPHIVDISANVSGNDYVIGDVHGNRACLEQVLALLKKDDRLFIVGDLVDKGDDNAGVVELIMRQPAGKVYCVRGNHEDLCLASLVQLEATAGAIDGIPDEDFQLAISSMEQREQDHLQNETARRNVWAHVINGGGWLVRLFKEELREGLIDVAAGVHVEYQPGSRIAAIKHYLEGLPYIINVENDYALGKLPFRVVHADMPLSEVDFETKMIDGDYYLNEEQIRYATWARERSVFPSHDVPISDDLHNFCETITYVGHTIVTDESLAIRMKGNVVDTDIGTYAYHAVMLVNHTERTATIIGENKAQFEEILERVNVHLDMQLVNELIISTGGGSIENIALLMKMGADPSECIQLNDANQEEFNAMMVAIMNDQEEVALYFLQNGIDAAADDAQYFHLAVRNQKIGVVKIFLKEHPELVDILYSDGNNALHWAVFKGWVEMVRVLLDHNASPAVKVGEGKKNNNKRKGLIAEWLTKDIEIQAMLGEAEIKQKAKRPASAGLSRASTFASSGARAAAAQNDPSIESDRSTLKSKK